MKQLLFDEIPGSYWAVDHLIPTKECGAFVDKEPYDGYMVRMLSCNDILQKHSALRYLLIDKKMYPKVFDFGNIFKLQRGFFSEKTKVSIGPQSFQMTKAIGPLESNSDLEQLLRRDVASHLERAAIWEGISNDDAAQPIGTWYSHDLWARIHVQEVGQGDTIIIELPNQQLWMVDARLWGEKRRKIFDRWMKDHFSGRKINCLIISHFHYDHIHSVPYIIDKYKPDIVLTTDSLSHTTTSARKALDAAGGHLKILKGNLTLKLGDLKIHLDRTDRYANIRNSKNPNDHEISVAIKSPNCFAFLSGDIPGPTCDHLFREPFYAGAPTHKMRYYKVSHHGSITGDCPTFFSNFQPNWSIISCGKNNRYKHPHCPPLQYLQRQGKTIITCKDGSNSYRCDLF